jgi:dolichol kinase
MVDRRHLARRALHVAVSLGLVYYWLPDNLGPAGLSKQAVAIAALVAVGLLEVVRLRRKAIFFPMREYERGQLAGHFWLAAGCVLAVVFFEERFAVITILGTTLVDPLIGELRDRANLRRWAPAAGIVAWCVVGLLCVLLIPLSVRIPLVPVGALMAVMAEGKKVRGVDDNFLMNVVPLAGMTTISWWAQL